MGKTRRKDKVFEDDIGYEDLREYSIPKTTKMKRGRCKKNKTRWSHEDELDDSQHESFQKIGKRK